MLCLDADRAGRILWSDDAMLAATARSGSGAPVAGPGWLRREWRNQWHLPATVTHAVGSRLLRLKVRNIQFNELTLCRASAIAEWDLDRWTSAQALDLLSNPSIGQVTRSGFVSID